MSKQLTAVELGVQHEDPQFNLGELYIDELGNHYRYMQADGAVTANVLYSYVPVTWQIDAPIKLAVEPANGKQVFCCASSVAITDNYYAWVFVGPGVVTLTTAGNVAVDVAIFGVNADGTVDDAITTCVIPGLTAVAAITGATTGSFYAPHALYAYDAP